MKPTEERKKPKDDSDARPPQFVPQNIAEFFFCDEVGTLPESLDFKEVDLIYNEYTRVMTCMHEKLRNFYNMIVIKTLSDKERRDYGFRIEQSKLTLPGEDEEEANEQSP